MNEIRETVKRPIAATYQHLERLIEAAHTELIARNFLKTRQYGRTESPRNKMSHYCVSQVFNVALRNKLLLS